MARSFYVSATLLNSEVYNCHNVTFSLEREEKIETLNHRLANLPEENIRAQLEQNIMGKDEKL